MDVVTGGLSERRVQTSGGWSVSAYFICWIEPPMERFGPRWRKDAEKKEDNEEERVCG